jgi:histidinol-phosphatase (PHP family)
MKYFNFHTHTFYCDGHATPEAFAEEAIRMKMSAIGFSSHSPLPFDNDYSIKESTLQHYKTEILRLKKIYKDHLQIYLSLEFDYIPGISDDFNFYKDMLGLDYTIGSVHLVKANNSQSLWFLDGPEINYSHGLSHIFKNNIQLAVKSYYTQVTEMILTQKPTIIGHIDKVKMYNRDKYFSETEEWYIELAEKTLEAALSAGCIIEVNTRGIYKKKCDSLYPSIALLQKIYALDIPITISSDAHAPEELTSYFPETISILKDIGFKKVKFFNGKDWEDSYF